MSDRVQIRKLPSGVPGFDEVLVGGIPEFSFNLIGGGPGCGKTTLGHQIMFANATPERKAIYFTIIGEPPIKMLRYQQQFSFFDASKGGYTRHWFLLCGASFHFFVGARLPEFTRRLCFAANRVAIAQPSDNMVDLIGQSVISAEAKGLLARMKADGRI